MPLLPAIEAATRLTREGKLAEALAALGGGREGSGPEPTGSAAQALRTLRDGTLGELLGGLGRLGVPRRGTEAPSRPGPEGASFTAHSFTSAAGSLAYKLYVPAAMAAAPRPLLVMLHGCTQSPDDFAAGTRMNALAEEEGILVAYPAQSQAANAQRCWNWFRAVDQGRSGEPSLVAGMVDAIARDHAVDRARIYVAGLSAGGAAAAVLGQMYPEIFAAVGVHSGLACGAAADMASAFAAMKAGALSPLEGTPVPTIVFHGDRDRTVSPRNGDQVLAQAEAGGPLTALVESGVSPGGLRYTRTVRADGHGLPQSEHWVLHGAGHAWSGGDPAGSYTDPRGPDASRAMMRFFNRHRSTCRR